MDFNGRRIPVRIGEERFADMFAFDDDPPSGFLPKWFGGAVIPVVIGLYGLSAIIAQKVNTPRRGYRRSGGELLGGDAIALGIAILGAAIFLHCHYFWGNTKNWAEYSILGKMIGAAVFVGGIGWLLVRLMNLA
jgi:hypothetical protein